MLINLIANAFNYCEAAAPALSLKELQRGRQLVLDFVDNGRGIPKDQQDLIFEKFSRAGDQKAGGAGLGLAICKEIMQRLDGDISYLPGQGGAGFRVLLPLDDGRSSKRV